MAEYADKINAAAMAMFPELWEDANPDWGPGALAIARQQAVDRVAAGFAAVEALERPAEEEFVVPDDLSSLDDTPAASGEDEPEKPARRLAQVSADGEGVPQVILNLPEGAKILQQSLTIAMYLDENGASAYTVACLGEGLTSTWLGMNVLCQDYLLAQHRDNGWSPE